MAGRLIDDGPSATHAHTHRHIHTHNRPPAAFFHSVLIHSFRSIHDSTHTQQGPRGGSTAAVSLGQRGSIERWRTGAWSAAIRVDLPACLPAAALTPDSLKSVVPPHPRRPSPPPQTPYLTDMRTLVKRTYTRQGPDHPHLLWLRHGQLGVHCQAHPHRLPGQVRGGGMYMHVCMRGGGMYVLCACVSHTRSPRTREWVLFLCASIGLGDPNHPFMHLVHVSTAMAGAGRRR